MRSHWDIFCRVVDNFGDIGVCWRLAADLASRGLRVRLWIDDPAALDWMAPHGCDGVEVRRWSAADTDRDRDRDTEAAPGAVVIESFGCALPERFVRCMASLNAPPLWINLEYLSAEPFVERVHGLASPQTTGAATGLTKRFFYPGFTPGTGGLIREAGLLERRSAFDRAAWLGALGIAPKPGEQVVSLFCYEQPALPAVLDRLARQPTLLLATAGHATRQVTEQLGAHLRRGELRAAALPWLSQPDYDRLLWSCDLNFVRGEDSFVRAQWAGVPFVWQIYPQHDGVHVGKLDAFLSRFGAGPAVRDLSHAWNSWHTWNTWHDSTTRAVDLPDLRPWRSACEAWRASLATQPDLTTQLLRFAAQSR